MRLVLLALLPCAFAIPNKAAAFDAANFKASDIITKDVAIIGGGSAGTYSAIRLKDQGKSVIVIEKKNRLGGHTETYIDPATGIPIDQGVIIWYISRDTFQKFDLLLIKHSRHNITIVQNYFARFNIPLAAYPSAPDPNAPPQTDADYDFRTGKEVNVTSPSNNETAAAFAAYTQFLELYPRLDDGMFLPSPVPDDLVLPFGEFAKKYNITAVIPTMYSYNPGLGNIFTVPTVEQIRVFGLTLVQSLSTGFLTTAHHNNSELYTRAQAELLAASSLFLQSEVQLASRCDGDSNIRLIVSTPSGKKLISAKKLLITIPPRLEFLAPFDLDTQEAGVFGKLIDAGYYTSILKDTGIPDTLSLTNAAPDTTFNIPPLPGVYSVGTTRVPGLHLAYYGTPRSNLTYPVPDETVQSGIIGGIQKIQQANPTKFNQTQPEFVTYSSHAPFYLQFRPEDTKAGYYDKLYALQGLRNTYWSGATFRAQDSSDIWKYTENEVLPNVLEGL